MKATVEQHQATLEATRQDTERPPARTIYHLPDEVLLEIFDSYRRGLDPYDRQWKKNHVWILLTHVCQRWRAVVFASPLRLDLCFTVGPQKPGHIKTILSSHLPILIDYNCVDVEITGSALWRMRTALKHHHERVREIAFEGARSDYDKLFKVTNRVFPALESLSLGTPYNDQPELPDTFLRGPPADPPSDLHHHHHLRCLDVRQFSLETISRFLLSATALTDLTLLIDTAIGLSPETSLLACLQGMPYLRRLDLTIGFDPDEPQPARRDVVPLSNLTCFSFTGHSSFLDAFVAGISAPSLRDVAIELLFGIPQPFVHFRGFESILRGPPADPPSDLHRHHHHHLRCLDMRNFSLASISRLLLSATALTDLTLLIDTAIGLSPETSLLACLQGMPYLRHLDVTIGFGPDESQPARRSSSSSNDVVPKVVPLSNLTCFRYTGHSSFLDALVAGISAPSLRDVAIDFLFGIRHLVHFRGFVNEIEERYHAVHVSSQHSDFRISLLTESEYVGHCEEPRFHLRRDMSDRSHNSVILMACSLVRRMMTVEKLRVTCCSAVNDDFERDFIDWRGFLLFFQSVKALRIEGVGASSVARLLRERIRVSPDDHDHPFLPVLEEIELGKDRLATDESQSADELAVFQPFVSARQQAGRPVKVFFSP